MLSFQSFIPIAINVEYMSINEMFHFHFANKKFAIKEKYIFNRVFFKLFKGNALKHKTLGLHTLGLHGQEYRCFI